MCIPDYGVSSSAASGSTGAPAGGYQPEQRLWITDPHEWGSATAVAFVDQAGDGMADMIAVAMDSVGTWGIRFVYRDGGGWTRRGPWVPSNTPIRDLAVADLDNDLHADLVARGDGTVQGFHNRGDGTFADWWSHTGSSSSLAVADVDGDTWVDLLLHSGPTTEICFNGATAAGALGDPYWNNNRVTVTVSGSAFAVPDLDSPMGFGSFTFTTMVPVTQAPARSFTAGSAYGVSGAAEMRTGVVGFLTNDGKSDFVTFDNNTGAARLVLRDGSGARAAESHALFPTGGSGDLALCQTESDFLQDVVAVRASGGANANVQLRIAHHSASGLPVLDGPGAVTLADFPYSFPTDTEVACGDVTGDQVDELAYVVVPSPFVYLYESAPGGGTSSSSSSSSSSGGGTTSCGTSSGGPQGVAESEPNAFADPDVIPVGGVANGTVGLADAQDNFRFHLDVTSDVIIETFDLNGTLACCDTTDTTVTLLTSTGVVLASDLDDGAGACSRLAPGVDAAVGRMAPGDYVVRVTAAFGSQAYHLSVRAAATCGNCVRESTEECDDGNLVSRDGCEPDCTRTQPLCNDLTRAPGEFCLGTARTVPVGEAAENCFPAKLVSADVDNDADRDLVVAMTGTCTNSENLRVLVNDGAGGFSTVVRASFTGAPASLHVAELDGDGYPELLVASDGALQFFDFGIAFNTLTVTPNYSIPGSHHALLGDLTGDGRADLVVGPLYGGLSAEIVRNPGTGDFRGVVSPNRATILSGVAYQKVPLAVEDVDGDTRADVIFTGDSSTATSAVMTVFQTAAFTFSAPVVEVVGKSGTARFGRMADLDGDGDRDVLTYREDSGAAYLARRGSAPFRAHGLYAPVRTDTDVQLFNAASGWGVDVGDLNGDGKADLAFNAISGASSGTAQKLFVALSRGTDLEFTAPHEVFAWTTGAGPYNGGILVTDVTRDGEPDIVAWSQRSKDVVILDATP